MKSWFIPSFHGDFRLEEKDGGSLLTVEAPTAVEREALRAFLTKAVTKGWVDPFQAMEKAVLDVGLKLSAPVHKTGALMAKIMSFDRKGVITSLKSRAGEISVHDVVAHKGKVKVDAEEDLYDEGDGKKEPEKKKKGTTTTSTALAKKAEASEVAVTVKRPSLSCPECDGKPLGERKACDVLWEFLSERQREEWLEKRGITVIGGLTGHMYRVRSRDTEGARLAGRTTIDLDDRVVLHNYDWTVPPEEEVLSVKLILEHRENWLRVFGEVDPIGRARHVFRNPFAGQAEMGW